MRFSRKTVAAALSAALAVSAAGAAWAAWSASGSGSGSAKAKTAVAITATAVTPSSADLYPGSTKAPVSFTLTNPNPYAVTITGVTYGALTATGSAVASDVTVDPSAQATASFVVPANTTTGTLTLSNVLDMSIDANNADQGEAFSVALTLTGTQS